MTEYERITQSPETLATFLASLPCIEGPWDEEFHKRYCSVCVEPECDRCPNEDFRSNPGWWLTLAAGQAAGMGTHVIDLDTAEVERPLTAEEEKALQKAKTLFRYAIESGNEAGAITIMPMGESAGITLHGESEVRIFIKLLLDSFREAGTAVRNA